MAWISATDAAFRGTYDEPYVREGNRRIAEIKDFCR
jgi:hypothetical protein